MKVPFLNKKDNKETLKDDDKPTKIDSFPKFRKIGETFNYLGVTCIVLSHVHHIYDDSFPELEASYVDKNGVIQSIVFSIEELPALLAQNSNRTLSEILDKISLSLFK